MRTIKFHITKKCYDLFENNNIKTNSEVEIEKVVDEAFEEYEFKDMAVDKKEMVELLNKIAQDNSLDKTPFL